MCSLYGFRANKPTKVECSLVRAQNALLMENRETSPAQERPNGWGIACYGDLESRFCLPDLVQHKTATLDGGFFNPRAESVFAHTVLAHVRLATVGYIGTMNSHPFTYDNWAFAHNGTIPAFAQLKDQLESESGKFQDSRCGSTDSEQLFHWLLSRLHQAGVDSCALDEAVVAKSLADSIALLESRIREVSSKTPSLTFILTNGRSTFACRFNTPLFQLSRHGEPECEICGIPHVQDSRDDDYHAVLFASEPITSEPWVPVANRTLSIVHNNEVLAVTTHEIAAIKPGKVHHA